MIRSTERYDDLNDIKTTILIADRPVNTQMLIYIKLNQDLDLDHWAGQITRRRGFSSTRTHKDMTSQAFSK